MNVDWIALAFTALKFILGILAKNELNASREQELAEIAAEVLRRNKFAKQVMEQINAMDDKAVDDLLHRLEPSELPKPDTKTNNNP